MAIGNVVGAQPGSGAKVNLVEDAGGDRVGQAKGDEIGRAGRFPVREVTATYVGKV